MKVITLAKSGSNRDHNKTTATSSAMRRMGAMTETGIVRIDDKILVRAVAGMSFCVTGSLTFSDNFAIVMMREIAISAATPRRAGPISERTPQYKCIKGDSGSNSDVLPRPRL